MTDPLVLLPGMMCDARMFMPQIIELGSELSVMVSPTCVGDTVEEIARTVLDSAPDRFALLGHAMGGIIAMEILRIAPRRIAKLALMDTNCQSEMPAIAAAREAQMVRARSGRLEEVMRGQIRPENLAPGPHQDDVLHIAVDMALDLGPEVFVRQSRVMQRRPDQQSTLRKAKTPTLVVCGEYDTISPVRRHEFMAHLMPNATLEVIPGAGHFPSLEQPQAVTRLLRRWLSQPVCVPA